MKDERIEAALRYLFQVGYNIGQSDALLKEPYNENAGRDYPIFNTREPEASILRNLAAADAVRGSDGGVWQESIDRIKALALEMCGSEECHEEWYRQIAREILALLPRQISDWASSPEAETALKATAEKIRQMEDEAKKASRISPELKSCPFCGGHNTLIRNEPTGMYKVRCGTDYVQTDVYDTPEDAVTAWNTRQPTPPAVTPDALSHVKMRLAQIASGDYRACGITAEDCAKDALKAMTGVGKTAVTQEVIEKVREALVDANNAICEPHLWEVRAAIAEALALLPGERRAENGTGAQETGAAHAVTQATLEKVRYNLQDIIEHSVDPFTGDKWRNYIREVAQEALALLPVKEG